MIKSLKLLLLPLLAIMVVSCSKYDKAIEYDYLPVKLVGSDLWSIINVQTGEVLYEDEFKNAPSAIYHDVFLVENENGTYDYYNINNVKTPINKTPYYMAADFVGSDVTPATLPGKQITLINTKCEVVATLDKKIQRCGKFSDGLAMFMDDADKCGFIDKTGKIVIKAKYDDGLVFSDGVSVCWTVDEDKDLNTYYAIDKTGKELFKFTSEEYELAGTFSEGRLPVCKDNEIIYLDKTGKKIQSLCKIEDAKYRYNLFNSNVFAMRDGRSVFCEGDMFGLKDKDGNIILRAKYGLLVNSGYGDGRYLAQKGDKFGLIDYEDNVVLDFKYDEMYLLRKDVLLAGNGKSSTLINDKGEDVTNVNISQASLQQIGMVKSNFFDVDAFVKKVMGSFTDASCAGYKMGTTLGDLKSELSGDANQYSYENELQITSGETGRPIRLLFDGYLARPTYSYDYYWGYRSFEGYEFNYGAELVSADMDYDISEYEGFEKPITEKIEAALTAKGYKRLENGYMEAPNGTAVGIGYNNGIIELHYYFAKGNYAKLTRIAHGSNVDEMQGVGEDKYPSAVDSDMIDSSAAVEITTDLELSSIDKKS